MSDWIQANDLTPWNKVDREEQRKRLAWSVATSCSRETGEQTVDIYRRLMNQFQDVDVRGHMALDESNESR